MANSSWLNWCWYSGTWRTPVTLSPSCHWWGELQQQHPCFQTFITQNHLWHAQTPSHCLSIISALKSGSDSLWLISGCVLLSLPSAYYGLVTWQYIFIFIFWNQINFKCKFVNAITLASHWPMSSHWQYQLMSLTDTCKVHHRLGTETYTMSHAGMIAVRM